MAKWKKVLELTAVAADGEYTFKAKRLTMGQVAAFEGKTEEAGMKFLESMIDSVEGEPVEDTPADIIIACVRAYGNFITGGTPRT